MTTIFLNSLRGFFDVTNAVTRWLLHGFAKMILITWIAMIPVPETLQSLGGPSTGSLTPLQKTMLILTIIVPPFLLAIISTIGLSRNSIKIILRHPEIIIMQTGTEKYAQTQVLTRFL